MNLFDLLDVNAERARRIYSILTGRLPIAETTEDHTARMQAKDELDKIFRDVLEAKKYEQAKRGSQS